MRVIKLGLSLVALMGLPVADALQPLVSPADDSDAVLALRSQTQGELRLQFTRQTPDKAAETVRVGIAKDYHYIQDGAATRLYDYRLRRTQTSGQSHTSGNNSLYADPYFRI